MSPHEIEQLAALIAAQIQGKAAGVPASVFAPAAPAERPKALVIGPSAPLAKVDTGYTLLNEDSYTGPGCLSAVERLYITGLTRNELAEIAQGQDRSRAACAVTSALLQGIPVYLLESALGWRKYARTGAPALLHLLEGYVSTLQTFGVNLIRSGEDAPAAPKPQTENEPPHVITEAWARKVAATGAGQLVLHADNILTPSAKDVFKEAGITVLRQ